MSTATIPATTTAGSVSRRRIIVMLPFPPRRSRDYAAELVRACRTIAKNSGCFGGLRAGIPQFALAVLNRTRGWRKAA